MATTYEGRSTHLPGNKRGDFLAERVSLLRNEERHLEVLWRTRKVSRHRRKLSDIKSEWKNNFVFQCRVVPRESALKIGN